MESSSGFGRRIIPSTGRSLTLVPEALEGVGADLTGRSELKENVRAVLMQQIDPVAAVGMPRQLLRAQVRALVSAIATEQKAQLNEAEENALANELTDDMVGLGPIEPLLQDETVTDILVNGREALTESLPCGVLLYVNRAAKAFEPGVSDPITLLVSP